MSGSAAIDQQCAFIKEQKDPMTIDQLTTSFDSILIVLKENKLLNDVATIQQVVEAVSLCPISNNNLVDHQLLSVICDCHIDILHRWRNNEILDPCSRRVSSQVAVMLANLCYHATEMNVYSLKRLLIRESLINELKASLHDIITYGKHVQDSQVESIDYTLRAIHYLEKGRIEIQNDSNVIALLNTVVSCVCSALFAETFPHAMKQEQLNEIETLLFDTCTNYICWHEADRYNEICLAVQTALLSTFTCWLKDNMLTLRELSTVATKIMDQLCTTLIGGGARDDEVFCEQVRENYCQVIDISFSILNEIAQSKKIDVSTTAVTRILTKSLYSLTMTSDLRAYIKGKQMVSLLLKLTNLEDETIGFHVYRILASIMTEEDIKTLANPYKIAHVFLQFFTNLIDDPSMTPRFHNLLRSLKILVQHDQIKDELTKAGVLFLLLRCATEIKFDPVKARLPALEILLALTFNIEAACQLKNNLHFISLLKTLPTSSTETGLQKVAEALLWKLDKEEAAIAIPDVQSTTGDVTTKVYDIMLSYSHSDKDLCNHIYDGLIRDNFRVWLDRDQMYGQTMVAMADAIENSEFVLLCMSDTYKQSAYCRSEAHYAFERQRHLIPLVVKPNYRPDGWLGIIASGKIYIDFHKLGFDVAYNKLKAEINQYRKTHTYSMTSKAQLRHDLPIENQSTKVHKALPLENLKSSVKDYPHRINQWTKDDVQSFLTNEHLETLIPVLGNMDGHLLYETYTRCQAHWDMMFQTFKAEVVADGRYKILTIDTYVRFLDKIQKYIPTKSTNPLSRKSAICNLI